MVLSTGNHSQDHLQYLKLGLWIAFKMVLSTGNHSIDLDLTDEQAVVNCFQNGTFHWKSQLNFVSPQSRLCCELLSKWYFPLEITATMIFEKRWKRLWIAFKMVLSTGNHSAFSVAVFAVLVVNCFQNGTFHWKSQHLSHPTHLIQCCELLSKWYFPLEITAYTHGKELPYRCELLSKWYFPLEITAYKSKGSIEKVLWIAFKMVLSTGNHSQFHNFPIFHKVVNCFQNGTFHWKSQLNQLLKF